MKSQKKDWTFYYDPHYLSKSTTGEIPPGAYYCVAVNCTPKSLYSRFTSYQVHFDLREKIGFSQNSDKNCVYLLGIPPVTNQEAFTLFTKGLSQSRTNFTISNKEAPFPQRTSVEVSAEKETLYYSSKKSAYYYPIPKKQDIYH